MAVIKVETFEIRSAEQPVDDEDSRAALELSKKLGLDEQVKAREDAVESAPFPYEVLGVLRKRMLAMIAPGSTDLKSYKCILPVRILQVAEQAMAAGSCTLKVRHLNSARIVDPVVTDETFLVAVAEKQEYLVARWGLTLSTWGALEKRARETYARKFVEEINKIKAQAAQDAGNIGEFADKFFSGEMNDYHAGMPTYSHPW